MAGRHLTFPIRTLFRREYWSVPERTLWTPCMAGMIAHLVDMVPGYLDAAGAEETKIAIATLETLKPPAVLSDKMRRWISGMARFGIPTTSRLMPEFIALDELGVGEDDSLATRLAGAERWIERTTAPLPWVALILSSQLTMGKDGCDHFMRAERPFGRLSKGFHALAVRQSLATWEAAVCASLDFWRDTRGDFAFWLMMRDESQRRQEERRRQERRDQPKARPAPEHDQLIKLERRLETAKAETAALADQMAQLQREHAGLKLEILEARQGRDRAVARLKAVTAGDRREATGDNGQGGQGGQGGIRAVEAVRAVKTVKTVKAGQGSDGGWRTAGCSISNQQLAISNVAKRPSSVAAESTSSRDMSARRRDGRWARRWSSMGPSARCSTATAAAISGRSGSIPRPSW